MFKFLSKILTISILITINALCSSCDKIMSTLVDEFNSERNSAIPKQASPETVYTKEPSEKEALSNRL